MHSVMQIFTFYLAPIFSVRRLEHKQKKNNFLHIIILTYFQFVFVFNYNIRLA